MRKGAAGEDKGGGEEAAGRRSISKRNRKRNEKRLGGRGLSLGAFSNARSQPSGYNPSLLKKQREFYRNAKYVSKYKKSLKQQTQSDDHLPLALALQGDDENENKTKVAVNKKNKNLRSLREDYEKRRAEEEMAKMEREAILQAKNEERARAEAKRKDLREKMFKKTRSGQPVMKYRIEHLLEGLIQNAGN